MRLPESRDIVSLIVSIFIFSLGTTLLRAEQTVGLFEYDTSSSDGYTLIASQNSSCVYLIDEFGRVVHSWDDTTYSFLAFPYLSPTGDLVRKVTAGGEISAHLVKYDWDGNKIWDWMCTDTSFSQHHDIQPLPNGNVLMNVRQNFSQDDFIALGGDISTFGGELLLAEGIIEVMPTGPTTGIIVWEWSIMDHLIQDFDPTKPNYGVVEDHPELLDLNFGMKYDSWLHANGVNYNTRFDQIAISLRLANEFWVIDHSTNTIQASGHTGGTRGMGGDILYRWGNPQSYRAGDSTDQQLSYQHNAHWAAEGYPGAGNILVFNNGNLWDYSSVVEIELPVDEFGDYPLPPPGIAHEPSSPIWSFTADPPESFFAPVRSGCQRLINGNTIMVNGPDGLIREVNPAGEVVWLYQNPDGRTGPTVQGEDPIATLMFLVHRYPLDYPAFDGRTLLPGATIEIYPITLSGTTVFPPEPHESDTQVVIRSTITSDSGLAGTTAMVDFGTGYQAFPMFDDGLHMDGSANDS
ncbi:MAG: aryl-sulfate sulfotransferase, partial [candidate division Zixibacteria bacterium]|nr:aryl-sulfate sulfotransferase [candidate division Zixibacteria bacterium]